MGFNSGFKGLNSVCLSLSLSLVFPLTDYMTDFWEMWYYRYGMDTIYAVLSNNNNLLASQTSEMEP